MLACRDSRPPGPSLLFSVASEIAHRSSDLSSSERDVLLSRLLEATRLNADLHSSIQRLMCASPSISSQYPTGRCSPSIQLTSLVARPLESSEIRYDASTTAATVTSNTDYTLEVTPPSPTSPLPPHILLSSPAAASSVTANLPPPAMTNSSGRIPFHLRLSPSPSSPNSDRSNNSNNHNDHENNKDSAAVSCSLALLSFVVQSIRPTLAVLWSYVTWWIFIVAWYGDNGSQIWVSALSISAVVGFALNNNAYTPPFGEFLRTKKFQILRFWAIPFCVSSFSGIANAHNFFLFFPRDYTSVITGLSLSLGVYLVMRLAHYFGVIYLANRGL